MTTCHVQGSAAIELYFYDELNAAERASVEQHLAECAECRRALDELTVIRTALDARPAVSAPAGGDWSRFMRRLDAALRAEGVPQSGSALRAEGVPQSRSDSRRVVAFGSGRFAAALAMAALVVFVTMTVLLVLRNRSAPIGTQPSPAPAAAARVPPAAVAPVDAGTDAALAQISEQHLERSKLVVLGLATKNPSDSTGSSWDYERTLASSLLSDTRLYRQTAEERGMKPLADVLRDLELVLLQTSMSETPDAESLAQLQRLIRRRDLITKMDVVTTAGLAP